MAANKAKKGPDSGSTSTRVVVKKATKMEVTALMKSTIVESKKLLKDGCSKAEAAREAFDKLSKHERRQVIHVFMQGCALSKAGAGTYYQNCKSK